MPRLVIVILLLSLTGNVYAQERQRGQIRERLLQKFDQNGDGQLDRDERKKMRAWIRERRETIQPAVLPGLYASEPGQLEVTSQGLELRDEQRDKSLQVKVTFPRQEGSFPLIVYSHGAFGSKDNYGPLVSHWVSHGYVVIQASHSDSLSLGGAGGRPGDVGDMRNFQDWHNRPKDVRFILDSLDLVENRTGCSIDRNRIGVGGHSYGAHTSQLLAGAKTRKNRHGSDHSDPRPKAFLLISPQGQGGLLTANSWAAVKRPLMVITGSEDKVRTGDEPKTRLDPYRLSPPGHKHALWIEGAAHNFGGIGGAVGLLQQGRKKSDTSGLRGQHIHGLLGHLPQRQASGARFFDKWYSPRFQTST